MDIIQKLTEELEVKKWQVEAAVKLIDEGNTIPFISRYRKEATGPEFATSLIKPYKIFPYFARFSLLFLRLYGIILI